MYVSCEGTRSDRSGNAVLGIGVEMLLRKSWEIDVWTCSFPRS